MKQKKELIINFTNDLNQFKKFEGNRSVKDKNVENLIDSIRKQGYNSAYPIILDKSFRVVDGQHRLEACKKIMKSGDHGEFDGCISFVISPDDDWTIDKIRSYNSTQKSWNPYDFLKLYNDDVKNKYKEAKSIMPRLSIPQFCAIFDENDDISNCSKRFNDGEFKLSKSINATRLLFFIASCYQNKIKITTRFIKAIRYVSTHLRDSYGHTIIFDYDRLAKKLSGIKGLKAIRSASNANTIDEAKKLIQEVYNSREKAKFLVK